MKIIYFDKDIIDYSFTRIEVIITINKAISDHKDCENLFYIGNKPIQQENCFIGTMFIKKVEFKPTRIVDIKTTNNPSNWHLIILIDRAIIWKECKDLVDKFCIYQAYQFLRSYNYIQNSSGPQFEYDFLKLKVQYGKNETNMEAEAFCRYGKISSVSKSEFSQYDKKLPYEPFSLTIQSDFLNALNSKDQLSRYVLLYLFFERIFMLPDFKQAQKHLEYLEHRPLNKGKYKPKVLLYFLNQNGVFHYNDFNKECLITEEILEVIIKKRNELVHCYNTKDLYEILYRNFLPIIKEIIRSDIFSLEYPPVVNDS